MNNATATFYMDHEYTVAVVETTDALTIQEAYKTIDGGDKLTQTNIAVAFYNWGTKRFFAQALARKAVNLSGSPHEISAAYGMKAMVLSNQFRLENNLNELMWSTELHNIAFDHSLTMAMGVVPFGHDGMEQRLERAVQLIPGTGSLAENVAMNSVKPIDAGVELAVQ